jgi:hypothetical protein
MRIVIEIEGGLVQNVYTIADGETNNAVVVDYDTEGADSDDITFSKDSGGGQIEAIVHTEQLIKLPTNCDARRLVEAYDTANRA